jgi:hypothetical protein
MKVVLRKCPFGLIISNIFSSQENFYARGDGTRCYFFDESDLLKMFVDDNGFENVQCISDRRLQVNRGKKLKMYRVWIQGKFRKPIQVEDR